MARIGYIDAMRGMTMILVVYSHVCHFCMGSVTFGGNDVMFLFRLPCFFFISGWLFRALWSSTDEASLREPAGRLIARKARQQLVPTVVFLALLVGVWCVVHKAPFATSFLSRLGATKGGYWFTVTLFEFFVIYLLGAKVVSLTTQMMKARRGGRAVVRCRKGSDGCRLMMAVVISALAFAYDVHYHHLVTTHPLPLVYRSLGFLGVMTWRYYIFFFLGALARQHFDVFQRLCDSSVFLWLNVGAFIAAVFMLHYSSAWHAFLRLMVGGVAGMVLVFACFRRAGSQRGRWLQYVGRRTLDIYLLHYFFLPRQLLDVAPVIRQESSLLALAVVCLITAAVVVACLLVSMLLRRSPFLAFWLFGGRRRIRHR